MKTKGRGLIAALLCAALAVLCAPPAFAAEPAQESGGYGIEIPLTPSPRTGRYRFEVYDKEAADGAAPLVSEEKTVAPGQSAVFLRFVYDPEDQHDYLLRVTALPAPERTGLDAPASTESTFTTGKSSTCGHALSAGGFLAGDGSAAAPFLVATNSQFEHVKSHLAASFIQCRDLDFGGKTLAAPYGTLSGTYEGGFHAVRNAVTNLAWMLEISGTVRNLGLENFTVSARSGHSGGIMTRQLAKGGLIENCYVSGCSATASCAVGMVGVIESGSTIRNCYSLNCTLRAPTSGYSAGGIAGACWGGVIESCWVVPTAISSSLKPGGIVGDQQFSGTVRECYFLSGSTWNNGKGAALSDAQLKTSSTYQNWDPDVWEIADGSYPALKGF